MRAATWRLPFPGVFLGPALAIVLSACAPVEPFGEAAGEPDGNQVRDGREAAEDAARRIAAVGAGVARQLGEVARGLQAGPDDDTRADEDETPIVATEETP